MESLAETLLDKIVSFSMSLFKYLSSYLFLSIFYVCVNISI